jgi:hypothetical protein
LGKECLCVGLSNAAAIAYDQRFIKNLNAVTICPGPNIAYFSQVVSLQTMTDHIYGRTNIITDELRPHMFIAELNLYINYFEEQSAGNDRNERDAKQIKYWDDFYKNLFAGIAYYRRLPIIALRDQDKFNLALNQAEIRLQAINH